MADYDLPETARHFVEALRQYPDYPLFSAFAVAIELKSRDERNAMMLKIIDAILGPPIRVEKLSPTKKLEKVRPES